MTNHPNRPTYYKLSHVEQVAGKRADFRVFYRRNGKLYFDAMWAPTAEAATTKFLALAKEMRWKVTHIRTDVVPPAPSTTSAIRS